MPKRCHASTASLDVVDHVVQTENIPDSEYEPLHGNCPHLAFDRGDAVGIVGQLSGLK
jgi:hypothetical protein